MRQSRACFLILIPATRASPFRIALSPPQFSRLLFCLAMFSHSTAEWTAAFYLVEHVITPDSSAAALNAVSSVIPWAFLGVMNSIVIFHLLHPAEICYNIPHVAFSPQVDMHESPVCPLTGVAAPNDDLCRPMATHSPVTGPSTTVSMVTSSAARQIQPHYSPVPGRRGTPQFYYNHRYAALSMLRCNLV